MFYVVGDGGFFGLLLVSLIDEIVCFHNRSRTNVRARQDEALSSRRGLFQTKSLCCHESRSDLVFGMWTSAESVGPCFGIHVRSVRLRNTHRFGNSSCHENQLLRNLFMQF